MIRKLELAAAVVDSPYSADGSWFAGKTDNVAINLNESSTARRVASGELHAVHNRADSHFRSLYEASQGSNGSLAIDPSQEPVDTSPGFSGGFNDHRLNAIRKLVRIREYLGHDGFHICQHMSGEGRSASELAMGFSHQSTRRQAEHISWWHKRCLEAIAKHEGWLSY